MLGGAWACGPCAAHLLVKPHIALGTVLNLMLSSSSRVMKPYDDDDDEDYAQNKRSSALPKLIHKSVE